MSFLALCSMLLMLTLVDYVTADLIPWHDGCCRVTFVQCSAFVKHPLGCRNPGGTQRLTMRWCLCCRGCCSWASCSCRRPPSQRPWASSSSCRQPAGAYAVSHVNTPAPGTQALAVLARAAPPCDEIGPPASQDRGAAGRMHQQEECWRIEPRLLTARPIVRLAGGRRSSPG